MTKRQSRYYEINYKLFPFINKSVKAVKSDVRYRATNFTLQRDNYVAGIRSNIAGKNYMKLSATKSDRYYANFVNKNTVLKAHESAKSIKRERRELRKKLSPEKYSDYINEIKNYTEERRRKRVSFERGYVACEKEKLAKKNYAIRIADVMAADGYTDVNGYIKKRLDNMDIVIHSRRSRFKRKALLHEWNYFVTVTYSDENFDNEEDFRKSLKKTLSNCHTRRGWVYMGFFERGEYGRLHFHAIAYIPKAFKIASGLNTFIDVMRYSNEKKCKINIHTNVFFEKKFGYCDFEPITGLDISEAERYLYIVKYIGKSLEKGVYSRGASEYVYVRVSGRDILADMKNRYLLFSHFKAHELEKREENTYENMLNSFLLAG